jgi:predicted adenine nucleotide alpha hydrolase (AANH) superfamily ATPase
MRMLLHICCAPCAVAIAGRFIEDPDISLEGYFFNPNIHPMEEFNKRKASVEAMSQDLGFPVAFSDDNRLDFWLGSLSGNKESRCLACYSIRLEEAARYAASNGFDTFTTSLLISPYQNHELLARLGKEAAERHNIAFYYEDFRNLYRKGREAARAKNWYMQKYCGCFYSYGESDHPKKPIYHMENYL